jgi:hypothetical protein
MLREMIDGARHFGLTDAEVLETIDRTLWAVGPDATVEELLEELTGVLARDILDKERRALSSGPQAAPEEEERPARSKDPR